MSQPDVTSVDRSKSGDDEAVKRTERDDHGELDYDEDDQPPFPSDTRHKAVDSEDKQHEDEKVDSCFRIFWTLLKAVCTSTGYVGAFSIRKLFK